MEFRKYIAACWLLLLPGMLVAQVAKKADQWFERGAYYKAFEEYRKLPAQYPECTELGYIAFRAGVCCMRMNDYTGAAEWLEKAEKSGCEETELYYILGNVSLTQGNYKQAKAYFVRYRENVPEDGRTSAKIASCDFAMKAINTNPGVTIEPLPYINTRGSEYGVQFVRGGILYSSTSDLLPEKRGEVSERTGMGYSKPYFSLYRDGEYQPGQLLKGIAKNRINEGTFSYDEVTGELYCTRCEENRMNCDIIRAQLTGHVYREIGALKIGKRNYNIAHPFVTDHGNRIYFSSTMEGGYGGSDLWYIDREVDGSWGIPVNLGPEINTPGNEVFPYIWEDLFFFSSDGHIGYGGLDIYRAKHLENGNWGKPQNLGAVINTSYDDFNLILHSDGTGGLLVSNRRPGRNDDIFRFEIRAFIIALQGTVKNKNTERALAGAKIILQEDDQETEIMTDRNGSFALMLTNGVRYRLTIQKNGYGSVTEEILADNYALKPFDAEGNRIEKVWFLAKENVPVKNMQEEEKTIPAEKAEKQAGQAEMLLHPEEHHDLDELASLSRLPYRLGVEVGDVEEQGWWVQVAMLMESRIIDYALAVRVTEVTGKHVVMYKGKDGGHRFYVGVYHTQQDARNTVTALKEAGIDCFVKHVTD